MSKVITHFIDPDGDVDLLLPRWEGLRSPFDVILTCVCPAPGLDYRRSTCDETRPDAEEVDPGVPSEYIQQYEEELPSTESQSDQIEENNRLDELVELPPNPGPESGAIHEQLPNNDQENMEEDRDAGLTLDEDYVRIRTSSKHLTLASPHFKRNLRSGMFEGQALRSHGYVEFSMEGQDPEAMLIVLNIIHGKSREVPRVVDLDMLTKLAVIVDYLECLEVMEPFSDRWVDNLKDHIPTSYSNALIQWLCISLIFRKPIQFKTVTRTAIRLSRDAIQTLSLPIRDSLVEKIHLQRYQALDRLISALEDLLDDFRRDHISCTFECNAMRYGLLAKELSFRKLLFPRPHIPFLGYSIHDTTTSLREIRDPKWCSRQPSSREYYGSYCQSHGCKLTSYIDSIIKSIENNLEDISLEDFP